MITSAKDAYTWRVTYRDGSTLDEYDENRPEGRGFAEVDSARIRIVELSDSHRIAVPAVAIPVFFRRRKIELDPNNDSVASSNTVHCIGWKDAKTNNACYLFVFEDGSTLLTDDIQAV